MPSADHEHDQLTDFLAEFPQMTATTVGMMVTSVDGRATIAGRVGNLTGEADQRVLRALREAAAAVVVGSGTRQAEGYDRLLDDDARARRAARGLAPEPELVELTRDGPAVEEVWAGLRARHPDALIVSEGGPTMLGVELGLGLIDQVVLCVSPMIAGGDGEKRIVEHPGTLGIELELLDSAVGGSYVFLRYRVRR